MSLHEADDHGGIDAARQEGSQGHVAPQPHPNGRVDHLRQRGSHFPSDIRCVRLQIRVPVTAEAAKPPRSNTAR